MLSYFYADCAITHISSAGNGSNSYSAEINGRRIEKIHLEPEFYEFLCGFGRNTKNRVWFVGKKNKLIVVAIETGKGERLVVKTSLLEIIMNLTLRPVAWGFAVFVGSFAVLFIPICLYYIITTGQTDAEPVMTTTLISAAVIGGLVGSAEIAAQLPLLFKIKRLDAWSSRDVSRYTKHIFGSG